jgi:hypothetical protein
VTWSNLRQGGVTIVVAILYGVATFGGSSAADDWHRSVTAEIKRDAAIVEVARHVYAVEAPDAFDLALVEARAGRLPDADAATATQIAFARRKSMRGEDALGADERQRLPGGGYDVSARLAALRDQAADLQRLDPRRFVVDGDHKRERAERIAAAAIVVVVAYLLAEVVLWLRRRRPRASGDVAATVHDDEDVKLVPRPWGVPRGLRAGATVAFAAWLLIVLLPVALTVSTGEGERASAAAARRAVEASTALQAGGLRASFVANATRRVHAFGLERTARSFVELTTNDPRQRAGLAAQSRAAGTMATRAATIATAMARAPTVHDGVDPAAVAAVTSTAQRADAIVRVQRADAARADDAARRSSRISLALVLAGLTLSLTALAAAGGIAVGVMRAAAAVMLLAALVSAASALTV